MAKSVRVVGLAVVLTAVSLTATRAAVSLAVARALVSFAATRAAVSLAARAGVLALSLGGVALVATAAGRASSLCSHTVCAWVAISSGEGAGRFLPFGFLVAMAGLDSSARTESTHAAWRTTAIESAIRRAFRRLSVRARKATACASASLAFLFPKNGTLSRRSSLEH